MLPLRLLRGPCVLFALLTLSLFAFLLLPPGVARSQSFQGIGLLMGGSPVMSQANSVSGDGNVVVGSARDGAGTRAIVWTALGGLGAFTAGGGMPVGDTAYGVDFDGDTVAGFSTLFRLTDPGNPISGIFYATAHLWLNGVLTGISGLDPVGPSAGYARDLSSDGTVAVGVDSEDFSGPFGTGPERAFRRYSTGQIFSLGLLPGYPSSEATGISGDGLVIVGFGELGFTSEAFRWTIGTGLQGLGILPNTALFPGSRAQGISADGSSIVGNTSSSAAPGGSEAFRWRQSTGMVGLGVSSGFTSSGANAASVDGNRIVGFLGIIDFINPPVQVAAFYDETLGTYYPLQPILENLLGSLGGWQLETATGISDDGTVIVGNGINPAGQSEGWIATLPVPEPSGGLLFGILLLASLGADLPRSGNSRSK